MSAPPDRPKSGCILFIIPCPPEAHDADNRPASFELEIPLDDLKQLVLRPVRWLELIAWGVLNCTGQVLDKNEVLLHEDALYDQFPAGAAYSFLPDQDARFSLMNLEHFRAKSRTYPTSLPDSASVSSTSSVYSDDSADTAQNEALEDRDGNASVFSGYTPIKKAQILPRRFARDPQSLQSLAEDRDMAVKHYTDAQNRLNMIMSTSRTWDEHECFILATDPQFIRDQDVPQPRGPPLGHANWVARPEPTGETYILQSLERLLEPSNSMRRFVRFNERARFASDTPELRPCPKAINYIYAAGMVELYRRPCPDGERVLSRPLAVVAPARRKGPTPREKELEEFYEMTHGAALRQVQQLQRGEDEARMRRLRDWRAGSAT